MIGYRKDAPYVILASSIILKKIYSFFCSPVKWKCYYNGFWEKDVIFMQRNTDFEDVHCYKAALQLVVLEAWDCMFFRSYQDHLPSFSATKHVQKVIYEI